MKYRDISIPFLDEDIIENKANQFRDKFWNNIVPIDIVKIIELKMKIDIIPLPGLQKLCDVDALITSDWKNIYVDNDNYMDDRYENRLRFSLSHEIGHYVLHKNIYSSFEIKNFKDFYNFMDKFSDKQYSYLEVQANKFANYLLIPREKLILERDEIIKSNSEIKNIDIKIINPYIATNLSNIFGVSNKAMEIALNDIV